MRCSRVSPAAKIDTRQPDSEREAFVTAWFRGAVERQRVAEACRPQRRRLPSVAREEALQVRCSCCRALLRYARKGS